MAWAMPPIMPSAASDSNQLVSEATMRYVVWGGARHGRARGVRRDVLVNCLPTAPSELKTEPPPVVFSPMGSCLVVSDHILRRITKSSGYALL